MTSSLLVLSAWAVVGVLITLFAAVLRQRRTAETGTPVNPFRGEGGLS